MNDSLKQGDTVRLKSGGPKMTIVEVYNSDNGLSAHCTWFGATNDLQDGHFPLAALNQE